MLLKFQISQWYFSRKLLYIKIGYVECFAAILVNFNSVLFNGLEAWSFSGTKALKFTENIVHNPEEKCFMEINVHTNHQFVIVSVSHGCLWRIFLIFMNYRDVEHAFLELKLRNIDITDVFDWN